MGTVLQEAPFMFSKPEKVSEQDLWHAGRCEDSEVPDREDDAHAHPNMYYPGRSAKRGASTKVLSTPDKL
jgi:hypothetical protein